MKVKITEAKSKEWFVFEVEPNQEIWGRSSALQQVFDELKLAPATGQSRWSLLLGAAPTAGGKEVVPDVKTSGKTWHDIGARDDDQYFLAYIAGGGSGTIKDEQWLARFLDVQETELQQNFKPLQSCQKFEVWKRTKIPSTKESPLPVARKYSIDISAVGFIEPGPGTEPLMINRHKFDLFILQTFPDAVDEIDGALLGAPVRFCWRSAIFHPNIRTGIDAGGVGYVCWDLVTKENGWSRDERLLTIIEGIHLLVEKPNLKSPLNHTECRRARDWYDRRYPQGATNSASLGQEERPSVILRRGRG